MFSNVDPFPYSLRETPNIENKHYVKPNIDQSRKPLISSEKKLDHERRSQDLEQLLNDKRISGVFKYYVSIDSRRRKILDEINGQTANATLPKNPLTFDRTKTVTVNYPDHRLSDGDQIYITNITPPTFQLDYLFEARQGTSFVRIFFPSGNGLTSDYVGVNNLFLKIQGATSPVSNFGPNLLNQIYPLYLTCDYSQFPDGLGNTDSVSQTFNTSYLYIKLPFESTEFYSDIDSNTNSNTVVQYLFIAGVPLYYLNNGTPQNIEHLNPSQTITNIIDENTFQFKIPVKSIVSVSTGGKFVKLSQIQNIINGFPQANQYTINLGRTFNNVIKVSMVDSIFPKEIVNVTTIPVSKTNNTLDWYDCSDSEPILRQLMIESGLYSEKELEKAIEDSALLVERTPIVYPSYSNNFTNTNIFEVPTGHYFKSTIDKKTNLVKIDSYLKTGMVNSMFIQRVSANETRLYIILQGHSAKVGQNILITDAPNVGAIPASAINGTHVVDAINELSTATVIDPFLATSITYLTGDPDYKEVETIRIILPQYNQLFNPNPATDTITYFYCPLLSEVITFNIWIPDLIQMLFTSKITLGNLLGFRRTGTPGAITICTSSVSNNSIYTDEINLPNIFRQNAINLEVSQYIFMCCPQLVPLRTAIYGTTPVQNAVFKIQLNNNGCNDSTIMDSRYVFNSFVDSSIYFEDPVSKLTTLDIQFQNSDGSLCDFQGLQHSYMLEIEVLEAQPDNIDISSRTGVIYKSIKDPTKNSIVRNTKKNPQTMLKKLERN